MVGQYDPERQQRWERFISQLRFVFGLGTLVLTAGLAEGVLLEHLPAYAMAPAAASFLSYLFLWFLREPPRNWQPAAEDPHVNRRAQRVLRFSLFHLVISGITLAIIIFVLAGVFRVP
jgi:hypothetical protein